MTMNCNDTKNTLCKPEIVKYFVGYDKRCSLNHEMFLIFHIPEWPGACNTHKELKSISSTHHSLWQWLYRHHPRHQLPILSSHQVAIIKRVPAAPTLGQLYCRVFKRAPNWKRPWPWTKVVPYLRAKWAMRRRRRRRQHDQYRTMLQPVQGLEQQMVAMQPKQIMECKN